ncbi:hypothetical protein ACHAWF_015628, partial [Thalassiosira exigua]
FGRSSVASSSVGAGLAGGASAADDGDGERTVDSAASSLAGSRRRERVLRYGETAESLFCLGEEGGREDGGRHRVLCREICSGDRADDPVAWREALELSFAAHDSSQGPDVGKKLIQLLRRATSRFKLSAENTDNGTDRNAVLHIWLLYALALLKFGRGNPPNGGGSKEDARRTYWHVQRLHFGGKGARFYAALAPTESGGDVPGDAGAVVASLWRVLSDRGSIVGIVRDQMGRLERDGLLTQNSGARSKSVAALDGAAAPIRQISLPTLRSRAERPAAARLLGRGDEKHAEEAPAAKKDEREKSAEKERASSPTKGRESTPQMEYQYDKYSKDARAARLLRRDCEKISTASSRVSQPLQSSKRCGNGGYDDNAKRAEPFIHEKSGSRKRSRMATDQRNAALEPHPYQGRTSAREAGGAKGGGLRAILSQKAEDSDDDSDDGKLSADSCASTVVAKKSADSCASTEASGPRGNGPDNADGGNLFKDISPIDTEPTTSVKDIDLGYLLSWDPTKRGGEAPVKKKRVTIVEGPNDSEVREGIREGGKEKPSRPRKLTRNDLGYMLQWNPFPNDQGDQEKGELEDNDPGARSSRVELRRNNMSTIEEATEGSMTSGDGEKNISESRTSRSSAGSDPQGDNQYEESTSQEGSMISTSKLNCSFLPLIENNNIIRVDGEPYAKLGVIGKGGSCKVYRALSRECDVVALKKVKIDGLCKAAIDGYANEIALLKRLKGNPAIIQLYSAEVDLERKSIYLVMEIGEVDLNYVLRQQEMVSSKQRGRSSLNMNFIRLTWQQMLTAVHSIHEERIIHSDLKPANFLFVRGALKLIDFGIAKASDREDTTHVYRETLSGTLSYMSPEAIMDTSTNADGKRVNRCGRPSDIWSLGCILYQMVYGKTPFADCHGMPQKVLAITNENHEIPYPERGVDKYAIDAMKSCLQRIPKQRPPIVGKNGLLNEHCFLHGNAER